MRLGMADALYQHSKKEPNDYEINTLDGISDHRVARSNLRESLGATHYKSFAYNLGRGLIWPVVMIPALGKIIGAIVLVAVVIAILVFVKTKD
ncbi:putative membrane-bound spermidine synthase [Paraburkholderia sp. GAS41]|uniref:hypothetical protein n=1 Tax=Paraburkholderia sp. GAS41 TaxID=3035134 RepID=UPI003D22217E